MPFADIADRKEDLVGGLYTLALRAMAFNTLETTVPRIAMQRDSIEYSTAMNLLRQIQASDGSERFARCIIGHIGGIPRSVTHDVHLDAKFFHPLVENEAARAMEIWTRSLGALHVQDWTTAQVLWAESRPSTRAESNLNRAIFFYTGLDMRTETVYLRQAFRHECDRAGVTLLLAAAIYESRTGHPPESLENLVPELLPEPVADPFSSRGDPMRFRKDPDGLTFWSVGEDAVDDGGTVLFDGPGKRRLRYGTASKAQTDVIYGAAWNAARPSVTTAPSP